MTINAQQAADIVRKSSGQHNSRAIVDALGNQGFVVQFEPGAETDPYADLPFFVDAETGEPRTIPAQEFVEISDQLTPVGTL